MAKLIVIFATLALFVLLANASIYRATVELDEEEDNQIQGRCRREFRQQQHLRACQRYIRRRAIGGGIYEDFDADDETEDELDEVDQMRPPALRRCCNQLRQVDRQCICPVLRRAAHQQRIQGQVQGPYQVRQMFRVARNLPNICNIPVGTCPFSARPSYEVHASQ